MNKYTIYCTEEQTRKAFELGAPLIKYNCYIHRFVKPCGIGKEGYIIPTTEQMIGWLEEQGLQFLSNIDDDDKLFFNVYSNTQGIGTMGFDSRKEATLAAIDVALEYLIKYKK